MDIIKLAEVMNIPWVIRGNVLTLLGEQEFIELIFDNGTKEFNTSGGSEMTLLTSPIGDIVWMAAHTAHEDKKTGKKAFSLRLAIDPADDTEGWLKAVAKVNKKKVVTAKSYEANEGTSEKLKAILATGKVLVEARTQFQPTVSDAAGNVLEDIPMFFSESTGKARMIVEPYSSDKGGTINLIEIVLVEINSPENTGSSKETQAAELARIREQYRQLASE